MLQQVVAPLIPAPFSLDPPPAPVWDLGPLDSFASIAELRAWLPTAGSDADRRLAIALLIGTRHVLEILGYSFEDATAPADPAAIDLSVVDVRARWRQATIAAGVRYYQSPTVPWGVAGGWEMATYVRMSIPDVDMMLLGERQRFGFA